MSINEMSLMTVGERGNNDSQNNHKNAGDLSGGPVAVVLVAAVAVDKVGGDLVASARTQRVALTGYYIRQGAIEQRRLGRC